MNLSQANQDSNTLAKIDLIKPITWFDLMPKDYVYQNPLDTLTDEEFFGLIDGTDEAFAIMDKVNEVNRNAPVVENLNNQEIQITGYIVPLDYESEKISEFLLVPYFGACIHTPPPPSNQIVFVSLKEPINSDNIWDPYSITGKLIVEKIENNISLAGYKLEAEYAMIAPYEDIKTMEQAFQ